MTLTGFERVANSIGRGSVETRRQQGAAQAQGLIAALREPSQRSRRFSALSQNPLLLANICLVYFSRGELPRARWLLYSECVDLLLEHWRRWLGLQASAARRALEPLALVLHTRNTRTLSGHELKFLLESSLAEHGATFLLELRDQSGVFTGWGVDQYGFIHLAFQEYLTACELHRRLTAGDPEVYLWIAERYGQSWWQEVILILFSLSDRSICTELMRAILQRPAFINEPELFELLLEDADQLSAQPFVEIALETKPVEWETQLVAAQVIAQRFPEAFADVSGNLANVPSSEVRAWIMKRNALAAGAREVTVAEPSKVDLMFVPGGEFVMGSPAAEAGRREHEGPQHLVRISSFYLSRFPVTNEEYARFLDAHPRLAKPAFWGDRRFNQRGQPVVGVTWGEARQFAAWTGARLPTEAEWEYACRSGVIGSRYGELDEVAWTSKNSQGHPERVGQKLPNAWGFQDMLGNVWEWCGDWYGEYEEISQQDPSGWKTGSERVIRGGSWNALPAAARAAHRFRLSPSYREWDVGFRIARGHKNELSAPTERVLPPVLPNPEPSLAKFVWPSLTRKPTLHFPPYSLLHPRRPKPKGP